MNQYELDTLCVRAGYSPESGEPAVLPITQSTTFRYGTSQEMGDLFDLKANGFFYTRLANPTLDAVEKKIAELEGGVGAMVTSSGQAASMLSILNICHSGENIISSNAIYGGTFNLFFKTLKEMGIQVKFVAADATKEDIAKHFDDKTRAVFIETLSNPSMVVADIELFAESAHANDVPLIVDNTFPTPMNCRPFQFGADIIIHSTTKYMDGHATQVGGVIVDSGNFNWSSGKFPAFTEPDESYHGVVYTEQFGKAAYIVKARTHLMRDIGAQAAPMNAFLLNMGLETLALRMERHCENAQKIATYLSNHKKVEWVNYPGLESSPSYDLAKKYMPNGTCGVISFGVRGGKDESIRFIDALKLCSIATHVADLRTCVLHPASTTHRQLSDKQLQDAGVPADLIRLSVGIENSKDILADINQALELV